MFRPSLEVADVLRRFGPQWRRDNAGHISLDQRRVMTAIEICRTAVLGGHVERCEDCAHTRIAYNSCRNRHCPKCQWRAAESWLKAREAELLPVPYYHVVFTLPARIAAIAYHNKAKVYDLLFSAASKALTIIAADPKHLGARIGVTAVLHTWGQALDHHPHVHCIVPGGGISIYGSHWVHCRPGFFLSVRVLSRLFRRLFLEGLARLHASGELRFFGELEELVSPARFGKYIAPCKRVDWVVYAKQPFAGPKQVLSYLARYTHRVAISNSRLVAIEDDYVAFRWKNYRINGRNKSRVMRLTPAEFMRRFLMHVLPSGFHRIRHFGLFANNHRASKIEVCRNLLNMPLPEPEQADQTARDRVGSSMAMPPTCPCCGGSMVIIEVFASNYPRRYPPRRKDGL